MGKASSKRQPLKQVEFLVLAVLQDAPLHGYGIVQEVSQRTSGRVSLRAANLYRVLKRLEERGFLKYDEQASVRHLATQQHERSYYSITPLGRKVVVAEAQLLAGFVGDVLRPARS